VFGSLSTQAVLIDPTSTLPLPVTLSNGIELVFGR
jgi:hypothetical protein